jgi:hypothetical protein
MKRDSSVAYQAATYHGSRYFRDESHSRPVYYNAASMARHSSTVRSVRPPTVDNGFEYRDVAGGSAAFVSQARGTGSVFFLVNDDLNPLISDISDELRNFRAEFSSLHRLVAYDYQRLFLDLAWLEHPEVDDTTWRSHLDYNIVAILSAVDPWRARKVEGRSLQSYPTSDVAALDYDLPILLAHEVVLMHHCARRLAECMPTVHGLMRTKFETALKELGRLIHHFNRISAKRMVLRASVGVHQLKRSRSWG